MQTPRPSHVATLQAAIFLTLLSDEQMQAIDAAPTKADKEAIIFREFMAHKPQVRAALAEHADLLADAALLDVVEGR